MILLDICLSGGGVSKYIAALAQLPLVKKAKKPAFTLAENFLPLFNKPLKTGFTLAEVLITLGIIGIVAAMTLPTIVANYKKKEVAVRLEQTYSILSQAVLMSELENGPVE